MLLVKWLVETTGTEQCKVEPCIFRKMVDKQVSLMVGVHVDIILSGEKDACDASLDELNERFPIKHYEELKMYTGYVFVRDWKSGELEINQNAFAENLMVR